MRHIFLFTILLALTNCSSDAQPTTQPFDNFQDTSTVKKWLINVITDEGNNNDPKAADANLRSALTSEYYNYKIDWITLEYNDDMTEPQFHKKWQNRYDTKFVGKGGFFGLYQDNGKISVSVCRLLHSYGDTAQVYHVIVRDLDYKSDFAQDIKVISRDNRLLIDDIKEY